MAERLEDRVTGLAPPLTLENVLDVVKNVKSWRTLGQQIYHVWDSSKLNDIQHQHVSDEVCLKAVVEHFLRGKGRYKPSWRVVIWSLYEANEIQLAEHIRSFAEPVQDPTVTVKNVIGVMENVAVERRKEVWFQLDIVPRPQLEIYQKYSTEEQRIHACADVYVNCHPESSWTHLCQRLYWVKEITAVRKAKTFMPQTDPTLTVKNVIGVMENVAVERRREVWSRGAIVPPPQLEEIYQKYSTEEQMIHACADVYVNCRLESSWTHLCEGLYEEREMTAARKVKTFIPQTNPTLTVKNMIGVMENVAVERRREVCSNQNIVPDSQLEEIYRKYSTEEQRIHACADVYVNCHPEPSWTHLCEGLYEEMEMTAARKAKTFIPQIDPTWTTENVIGVMEKVTHGGAMAVWERLIYEDLLEDINSKCFTERELVHTCADIYINCDPDSNWEEVARGLYHTQETAVVEEVRSYLSPRDLTLTTERLVELFASMDDDWADDMGVYLGTLWSKAEEFKMNYKNPARRKEAYLDYYVHNNPLASWTEIADTLNTYDLPQQASVVENTYIQVSERTRINFEAAMKEGMLWIRNGNTFFLGPGGSGKTHTLHSLLEEDPPAIRDSTACAKKPIRAVAQFKVGVRGTARFIRITNDQYSEMLANSAEHFSAVPKSVALTEASQPLSSEKAVMLPSSSTVQIAETPSKSSSPTEIEKVPKQSSVENQLPVAEFGLRRELQCRMQAKSRTLELLDDKDLMDVKDSGGQPMFHEVLPVFVTNTMFGILTVKLNESLDSRPLVEYYISGRRIGEPFKSPFTHLQTFRHCLRVLQSTCDPDTCPKIVFVGTHKDLEHECPHEDRKEKNRKLQSIIPPEMKDNIIYNGESLLFAINAKIPGNDDRKLMGNLRQRMIKELQKIPKKKIPLRYFSLENAFQRLAKYQRRAVLSIDECLKEATAYHFTRESLDDVLQYLHNLKLIMYYKDILPDVVFIDAQVLLDKITELVEYSIELRAKSKSHAVVAGSLEKFKTCGIVTTEILSQFTSGYVQGLFEEKHLILVFKKLLIVAEIGKGKFLMPCLLEEENVQILSDSVVPPLLFYFGRNGPKLGVYCFLLASLITEAKWELLMEDNSPVQLSRNRVRFAIPGNNPGCITITDSFSTFFHVSIEFPDVDEISETKALEICEDVCPIIRETILTHIRKASHRLNYNNSIPEAAFFCSKHDETTPPHPATISKRELLTCTICPRSVCCRMTKKHALWLGKASSDSANAIPAIEGELSTKDLRKVQRAAWDARAKWYNIGLEMDIDPGTLDTIKRDNDNSDDRFRAMLMTWLKMVEPKPTWEALAEALRSPTVGYEHLAERCIMSPH